MTHNSGMPEVPETGENSTAKATKEVRPIDYLVVFWKWKFLIIAGTLICMIATGMMSIYKQKTYKISTVLELAEVINIKDTAGTGNETSAKPVNPRYIDSPKNVASKIILGLLNQDILERLKKNKGKNYDGLSGFKVTPHGERNILQVFYVTPEAQFGVDVLNSLKPVLLDHYKEKIKLMLPDYDQRFLEKNNNLTTLKAKQKALKSDIENISARIAELQSEFDILKRDTDLLKHKRNKSKSQKDQSLSEFIYSNTIQQNMFMTNTYKNDLYRYRSEREQKKIEAAQLSSQLELHQRELKTIEVDFKNFQYIKVIQSPESNIVPVKARTNAMILLGAIIGFFLTVFLAVVIEFVFKYQSFKKR